MDSEEVRGSYPKVNFDKLLEEWFEESGVDYWDFKRPNFRLIDSMWFSPKRSFDEFVRSRLSPTTAREKE